MTGVQLFRLQIWTEISHSLGLKKSTANQIQLNEMVVLDMCQPEMCFDRLEKQPQKSGVFIKLAKLEILSLEAP